MFQGLELAVFAVLCNVDRLNGEEKILLGVFDCADHDGDIPVS